MTYVVRYVHLLNTKDLVRFPKADLRLIKERIEQKLTTEPHIYAKPLQRSLRGYWSLRVGDYRVIFRIHKSGVLIFIIAHRSVVYETATKLLGA
jgi:mRNA interferase RelE/StbE